MTESLAILNENIKNNKVINNDHSTVEPLSRISREQKKFDIV